MNILIVNNSVIPAIAYGGTERVIWYLGKELAAMGHKVTYLVRKGSSCPFAKVIAINPFKPLCEQIPEEIDIVHFNSQWDDRCEKPYIVTIHGNEPIETPSLNSVFVSADHAKRNGCNSYVYNGLDWNDYGKPDYNSKKNYYHFLGKASWRVKNVKGAIDIIKKTTSGKLYVLGGDRLNIKMGFRFTLSTRAHFCGMVSGREKLTYLNESKGVVFPVRWHEPFGLALIESLYFGAPVYGTPYGSLPEIVTSEVGFLSSDGLEIARAIDNSAFNKKICHEYAADKFSAKIMAQEYLKKYEIALSGAPLCSEQPKQQPSDKGLLPFTI